MVARVVLKMASPCVIVHFLNSNVLGIFAFVLHSSIHPMWINPQIFPILVPQLYTAAIRVYMVARVVLKMASSMRNGPFFCIQTFWRRFMVTNEAANSFPAEKKKKNWREGQEDR